MRIQRDRSVYYLIVVSPVKHIIIHKMRLASDVKPE